MFTVELKINGSLIGHIYGRNMGQVTSGETKYEYDYYDVDRREQTKGELLFQREDGIRALVAAILSNEDKISRKNKQKKQS